MRQSLVKTKFLLQVLGQVRDRLDARLTMLSPFKRIRPSSLRLLSFFAQTSSASANVTFMNSSKPMILPSMRKSTLS